MTHIFPQLFKKTNTGAIQTWIIGVEGNKIVTVHGQVGGAMQSTTDEIHEGKNAGKANATTPKEQAAKEAEAKWLKQKKKRYVESIQEAEAGTVDESLILGGIAPMLAPSAIWPAGRPDKMKFPVWVQPKLDGARCIAVLEDGHCTLWTRTQKRILSLPHIERAIEEFFGPGAEREGIERLVLDGEAYTTALNGPSIGLVPVDNGFLQGPTAFEELMSAFRKDKPSPESALLQYHIYDVPKDGDWAFEARHVWLAGALPEKVGPLVPVHTITCFNDAEIELCHARNMELGYEGSMIRFNGPYEFGKRSAFLRKLKAFLDAEYRIIGAEEGRGKDAGTVGSFQCVTRDGKTFSCRLKASYAHREALFRDPSAWQGKYLTVKYQNLTADGIPRFPVGKAIRDGVSTP